MTTPARPAAPDFDTLSRALREMVLSGEKGAALSVLSRMRHLLRSAFTAAVLDADAQAAGETERIGFAVWDVGSATLVEEESDGGGHIFSVRACALDFAVELGEGYEVVEVRRPRATA
jgi:hypothetical protein